MRRGLAVAAAAVTVTVGMLALTTSGATGLAARAGTPILAGPFPPGEEEHGRADAAARTAPSGLPYSTASPYVVQRQPPPGSCHAIGAGLYARPQARCTPGGVNPQVTQATIGATICRSGWTSTVRPPVSVTEPEKYASMEAYGVTGRASAYEYDHLVPLELGGAVNDPRNLWPELNYTHAAGYDELNPKDALEYALKRRVCAGVMTLAQAQRLIASNWVTTYHRYG
ncbi:MAG TPA: hypothetical protein VKG82_06630 [Solirubrobacteraceae bacterium]|nr:hypothetical protein [Solirubrobacteraceae bacterium]